MLTLVLRLSGWILAHLPEAVLRLLAAAGGDLFLCIARGRRRLILSNLQHAFPEKPESWHLKIAKESSRRLFETALLSLAAPSLREDRIRRIAILGESVKGFARSLELAPHPVVLATLHLAHWEAQTWLKLLSESALPAFGIVYRPLDNPSADAYVKSTRERHGMKLLSRKEGFSEALGILRSNGCVGILFDQNAGSQGALSLFLDRVCSTTELPGLLAIKTRAEVRTFYVRRTGFWRVTFESEAVDHNGTIPGVTIALNRWLESAFQRDDGLCASWLWSHNRWRNQDVPERRLRLEAKRSLLPAELALRNLQALPRRTRIWIRMPNWLGDVVMALPLLRALRISRPDAEITLLAKSSFLPLLRSWSVADQLEALAPHGPGYFWHFWGLRKKYPDTWILLTNSVRGDLEAWIAGCPQRFGITRPGKMRPFLTHAYALGTGFDESKVHQTRLWEAFLRHFGLSSALDFSPIAGTGPPSEGPIGLIAGSENNPEKRWPVPFWRKVIEALPSEKFILFGVQGDAPITSAIATGFDPARVEDLAGRTDLMTYASRLQTCRLLIANDTGGLHLANSLGVPAIGLFGPSNPIRTGPIFPSPFRILQPAGCSPTGGGNLDLLAPEAVLAAVSGLAAGHLPKMVKGA